MQSLQQQQPDGEPLRSPRRRGHAPQISISDDTHHVTEAIGEMYGDNDWDGNGSRPTSFSGSFSEDFRENGFGQFEFSSIAPQAENPPPETLVHDQNAASSKRSANQQQRNRQSSLGSIGSATSSNPETRIPSTTPTASQHFPLTDIDYESSPAAVAQELSNLQAIRRMSMNVDAADPDLPSFGGGFVTPPTSPGQATDEEDAAKLFWVPARLHPELAPKEFKSFVEDRVERINRRAGEDGSLTPDGIERRGSGSSINRRRSMLSRSIDSPNGYRDGAEILERKRSQSSQQADGTGETTLHELGNIVNDQNATLAKLSLDSARASSESGHGDVDTPEDMPIITAAPGLQSLKRSTRTTYRKGSIRRGERVSLSRRKGRHTEGDQDDATSSAAIPPLPGQYTLSRVQTEPLPQPTESSENFARPSHITHGPPNIHPSASMEDMRTDDNITPHFETGDQPHPKSFQSRIASNGRSTASLPPSVVPQIVETPPPIENRNSAPVFGHPERKSSHEFNLSSSIPSIERPPMRPGLSRQKLPTQTLDDMANNPSMMPGTSTSTDALSFIPTFIDEKKPDKKSKGGKDHDAPRKTSWGWLLGGDDKREERERKEREKEEKEAAKRSKSRPKGNDKTYDSTRLDVLKTATDGSRPRESLVLDRDSLRLDEERKKDGSRKSTGNEGKKEAGLFSSLFGGGKKKTDRDSVGKKKEIRGLSPEPPPRILRADIDYNWTRFSILEERAIYRMAHIKLANPRRALYSQVLLSNFMYSYLAKVQQMHPSIQIPQFVTKNQKKHEKKEGKPPDEFSAWQRYQESHERNDERNTNSFDSSGSTVYSPQSNGSTYVDDYDPEHQRHEDSHNMVSNNDNGRYSAQRQQWEEPNQYSQQGLFDGPKSQEDENEMW